MAKHEFGIMPQEPQPGVRYDSYEPEVYRCISVDDVYVEALDAACADLDCCWHTRSRNAKGLAYCGITLIPPTSLKEFHAQLGNSAELCQLKELTERAMEQQKWIIHFGI